MDRGFTEPLRQAGATRLWGEELGARARAGLMGVRLQLCSPTAAPGGLHGPCTNQLWWSTSLSKSRSRELGVPAAAAGLLSLARTFPWVLWSRGHTNSPGAWWLQSDSPNSPPPPAWVAPHLVPASQVVDSFLFAPKSANFFQESRSKTKGTSCHLIQATKQAKR